MGVEDRGSGFRVQGSGFRVQGEPGFLLAGFDGWLDGGACPRRVLAHLLINSDP